MSATDPRVLAVEAGLRLLCMPRPCRARVEGGVLVYHWCASPQRRAAEQLAALRRAGVPSRCKRAPAHP